MKGPLSIEQLNQLTQAEFVATCGPWFEHSPWIAERTWAYRPFADHADLLRALLKTVETATDAEKLSLLLAHPDLVGKLAEAGELTSSSASEQRAAGLIGLTLSEVELFNRYNLAYQQRFGFPFIICARENKKEAILAAFPRRLANLRAEELRTALSEVGKIAGWRLKTDLGGTGTETLATKE